MVLIWIASGGYVALAQDASDPGLPAGYWALPLPAQGQAPESWSAIEARIDPPSCAECHEDKYKEWRGSFHSRAFSPGLVGQLLTYSKQDAQSCMNCHAPLAEQAEAFEAARRQDVGHRSEDQGIAASGVSCAGCHVRGHARFGPPQRDSGVVGMGDPESPHGGVLRTQDFERSEFCAACHQFPLDQAVNGKPLENTVEEWKASPQGKNGQTCQSCHMPQRQHAWRGIHDPKMTASGLTATTQSLADKVVFMVANTGVGHAFPTYVTPVAVLHAVLLDEKDQPIMSSETTYVIHRRVDYLGDAWVETADTRLLPGQTARVEIAWGEARKARVWLEVRPDEYYHQAVYSSLLNDLPGDSQARLLISRADDQAQASVYALFETTVERRAR
ncbi:MAG: hypothetical protein A2516_10975 [Alphaproteobacteria bacterium RIFOXYD12_FULL_60_8]|nr:MAG: hypothetical protein A2516_10975 [Alphaproteobacteria bacterium RIFOXYD12_FULL_60_8]